MVIDFRQRKVKIKLVWKILNQGKIWTTTDRCVATCRQRMRNNDLEIRRAGYSCHSQKRIWNKKEYMLDMPPGVGNYFWQAF